MNEELKNTIKNYGLVIDKKPKTEQIYKIFKIDGSFPFKPEFLKETLMLYKDYKNLDQKLNKNAK